MTQRRYTKTEKRWRQAMVEERRKDVADRRRMKDCTCDESTADVGITEASDVDSSCYWHGAGTQEVGGEK